MLPTVVGDGRIKSGRAGFGATIIPGEWPGGAPSSAGRSAIAEAWAARALHTVLATSCLTTAPEVETAAFPKLRWKRFSSTFLRLLQQLSGTRCPM